MLTGSPNPTPQGYMAPGIADKDPSLGYKTIAGVWDSIGNVVGLGNAGIGDYVAGSVDPGGAGVSAGTQRDIASNASAARLAQAQAKKYMTPQGYIPKQITSQDVYGDPYKAVGYTPLPGMADAYANADQQRLAALAGLQGQFSQQQQALKGAYNFGPDPASQIVQQRIIADLQAQQAAASQGINASYQQAIGATNAAANTVTHDAGAQSAAIASLYNQAANATQAQQAGNAAAVGGSNAGALGVTAAPLNGNQANAAAYTRQNGAAQASYAMQTANIGAQDLHALAASQGGQAAAQQGDLSRLVAGLINQSNNSYAQREMEREIAQRNSYRDAQTALMNHYMQRGENLTDQGGALALDQAKTIMGDQMNFRNTQMDRQFQDSQMRQGFDANQTADRLNKVNAAQAGTAYLATPQGQFESHMYNQALQHVMTENPPGKRYQDLVALKSSLSPQYQAYLQYGAYPADAAQPPDHPALGYPQGY